MEIIACKFGGTSLADADQFRKVAAVVKSDARRRIVVVSAPGKRFKGDPKITDMLISCFDLASKGLDPKPSLDLVAQRYLEIEKALDVDAGMAAALEELRARTLAGEGRDWIVSRGEAFSARLMAAYMGAELVDAEGRVFLTRQGLVDDKTWDVLGAALEGKALVVMPGFYGTGPDGAVKTFSRGGSDISGAVAARAAKAALYENWTDVSGLMMADPTIVANPLPMDRVTYRELRELAYLGANVFHDEAILPCKAAGIPIRIANTNRPQDPGTLIVPEEQAADRPIAGIAGRRNFSILQIEKPLMNKEKGFGRKVLGILETKGVSYELSPSGIDSMCVVIERSQLEGAQDAVLHDIRTICAPEDVSIQHGVALIATVGHGMAHRVGVAAKLFAALAGAGVNVRIIDQGASELSIIVGVDQGEYETAIRAIYASFLSE